MQVSEVKKLKVGDKVKIKKGSTSYKFYVSEMEQTVGMIATINGKYDTIDNDIVVALPNRIGSYSSLCFSFSPSWIECKIEDSKELPKVADNVVSFTREHPKAEVLRWIADSEEVEQQTTASKEWIELDTSKNFSIFKDHKYRKAEKKYQILCKTSVGKYYIATGLFTKEEANKLLNFVQILE